MLKVKKFNVKNDNFYTKALRLFVKGKVKVIISYSKLTVNTFWQDDDKNYRKFGYFKNKMQTGGNSYFTARAFILGKNKFSLLIAN